MANRKRRKKDGAGTTRIKWLLLFWFIGALYVTFLWYIGFIERDLIVEVGVTIIILGLVGYGLMALLWPSRPYHLPIVPAVVQVKNASRFAVSRLR